MKDIRIQIFGKINDSLPEGLTWCSAAYEDKFAFREKLTGYLLEGVPDLYLEIHTRPYYAHLMNRNAPKAVYFCNFPGGYFHNEAILDLYDFVFYNNIIGENYSRFHSNCHFLPQWMPDAFLSGSDSYGDNESNEFLGAKTDVAWCNTWSFNDVMAILMRYETLNGKWFLGEPGPGGDAVFLGVCFKADFVYVDSDSSFANLGRDIGAGSFIMEGNSFVIVDEPKERKFRRGKILKKHLFRERINQILSFCFPDRK